MKQIVELGIALLIMTIVVSCAACTQKRDNTDPPEGVSGMGLSTDHKTGCQYLTSPRGGITPRMNADGQHICRSN